MTDRTLKKMLSVLSLALCVQGVCLIAFSFVSSLKKKEEKTTETQMLSEDAFVTLGLEDNKILHQGDVIKNSDDGYLLKLNCGNEISTNDFKAYLVEPSQASYEEKCPKCFKDEREK